MKSSTSVVELVMLLCSQVSFFLPFLHNLLSQPPFVVLSHPLYFSICNVKFSCLFCFYVSQNILCHQLVKMCNKEAGFAHC